MIVAVLNTLVGPVTLARRTDSEAAWPRPACTFVEVSRFIDREWLVEVELDAVLDQES